MTGTGTANEATGAPKRRVDVASLLLEGRAFIALIVLIIIFALLSDSFLTVGNLITMTKHVAMNAILAIGMLFVILKGGIDVGAKAEIFALMARESRKGLAVLYATSEVGEALNASTRIVVLSKGRIVAQLDPRTTTREEVMIASGETVDEGNGDAR